jgi:hypothetical protein
MGAAIRYPLCQLDTCCVPEDVIFYTRNLRTTGFYGTSGILFGANTRISRISPMFAGQYLERG